MPWHALTFDGLDAVADAEFAEQTNGTVTAVGGPGVVTQVNAPLVTKFMDTVTPHIQKAVSAGLAEAVNANKQKLVIGGVVAGSAVAAALYFLWKMSSRMTECCPAQPRRLNGCCE